MPTAGCRICGVVEVAVVVVFFWKFVGESLGSKPPPSCWTVRHARIRRPTRRRRLLVASIAAFFYFSLFGVRACCRLGGSILLVRFVEVAVGWMLLALGGRRCCFNSFLSRNFSATQSTPGFYYVVLVCTVCMHVCRPVAGALCRTFFWADGSKSAGFIRVVVRWVLRLRACMERFAHADLPTTPPRNLGPLSEGAGRQLSFCARREWRRTKSHP